MFLCYPILFLVNSRWIRIVEAEYKTNPSTFCFDPSISEDREEKRIPKDARSYKVEEVLIY